jgi:large subunit ribosomal protein L25
MPTATEVVSATPREGKFNKNAARRVRVAGKIPGVIYGAKEPAVALELDPKQMQRILHSETGHNTIFEVSISGGRQVKAMIVDWQYEPIKDRLIHVDLKRIAMDKMMKVDVPIIVEGIPVGVKNEGGVLELVLREVEIECLPGDIPSSITVDVTDLALNASIRVADLPHDGKFKFISDEDATVVHVVTIKEEELPDPAAVATAGPAEPEVAKKGKTDEKADAAAAAAPAKGAKK